MEEHEASPGSDDAAAPVAAAAAVPAATPRRRVLALEDRVRVLEMKQRGESSRAIATQMDVGKTQISNILQSKERVLELWKGGTDASRKYAKGRSSKYEQLNDQVRDWYLEAKERDPVVTGPMIQAKAREVGQALGFPEFRGSNGWLDSFKKRFPGKAPVERDIIGPILVGEGSDSSEVEVNIVVNEHNDIVSCTVPMTCAAPAIHGQASNTMALSSVLAQSVVVAPSVAIATTALTAGASTTMSSSARASTPNTSTPPRRSTAQQGTSRTRPSSHASAVSNGGSRHTLATTATSSSHSNSSSGVSPYNAARTAALLQAEAQVAAVSRVLGVDPPDGVFCSTALLCAQQLRMYAAQNLLPRLEELADEAYSLLEHHQMHPAPLSDD
ncbi:uncharacterized protein LOC135812091 [Sycon ciliatum]|uniref:uncharacterized protein LOC135812091 n=1 Tax=Sycon ciliatum TaxID=27933 RepID=UPI0020A97A9D|eukprot:scpid82910/ scgid7217/ Tigger transposable element-derived protein 4